MFDKTTLPENAHDEIYLINFIIIFKAYILF